MSRAPLSANAGTALRAGLLFTFMAASSVPTPLYALYRELWHFSPATLTLVFAVYAASLLASLLTLGSLSDYLGRRPVILGAVFFELLSLLLFLFAGSVPMLVAARLLQGAATGVALSALGAAIGDSDRQHAPIINSVAPLAGLGIGALSSSVLAAAGPWPTHTVYALVFVALAWQGWAARQLPETARPRPGALASMRPRVAVPASVRRAFLLAAPIDVAAWALGGFLLSLGPTLARQVTGVQSPVIGGLMLATLTSAGAVASLLLRERPASLLMRTGGIGLVAGVALVLEATALASTPLFFIGTAVAGVGFGVGFLAALRSVLGAAAPEQRATVMAAFFVLSYCAFSLPALGAGYAAGLIGLKAAAQLLGSAVMALGVVALLGTLLPATAARAPG
ncbi:MFS transporter [Xylophilus rhododendri]|uniref:MFS transporter n=1 Tax=Xylophilus rhododendri TaxID=2697032 RepID=A0A857JC87_9BURK|nr:MFS transporter [Xylophilus rhododendri]QHJ00306.1 MFS transporter [Xylophilus rhododendri]